MTSEEAKLIAEILGEELPAEEITVDETILDETTEAGMDDAAAPCGASA